MAILLFLSTWYWYKTTFISMHAFEVSQFFMAVCELEYIKYKSGYHYQYQFNGELVFLLT